ncbi:MAG TPA: AI-2E family transporter [Actinomycetota bacterium]
MAEERKGPLWTPGVSRAARWGIIAWSAIGVLLILYWAFRYVIHPVRVIFPPLVLALIVVYLLNPIVSWLEGRGIPRVIGALLTYLVLLGALGVGLRYLIPVLVEQAQDFSRSLPSLLGRAQEAISDVLQRFGAEGDPGGLLDSGQVRAVTERLFNITIGLLNGAIILVIGLILGVYLLIDIPKIQRGIVALVPERRRPEVLTIGQRVGRAIGGFFRGQLLVALFVGVLSTLALYIVGLPYWALVGMITGLFNIIPLIGPFIGGAIAVFVAFATDAPGEGLLQLEAGWPLAIGSAIALVAVQQLDNHIVSPNVVARTVKMHPVTVMLALLAGGTLLGLWGMLLAVPVFASIKILALHAWDTQMTWPPRPPPTSAEVESSAPPPEPDAPPPSPPPRPTSRLSSWVDRWRSGRRRTAGSGRQEEAPSDEEQASKGAEERL